MGCFFFSHVQLQSRCGMGRSRESKGGGDCLECEELMGGSASVGSTNGYPRASSTLQSSKPFFDPHMLSFHILYLLDSHNDPVSS